MSASAAQSAVPAARHLYRLGPQAARDLSREVLLPDGLGGFALSSSAGVPTRCYSGLSVAHRPPGDRRVMFVTALEELRVGEQRCALHAFEVAPDTLEGQGLSVLSGVTLRDLLPEREQLALGVRIRRRSVVPRQSGTLILLYDIEAPHLRAGEDASLTLGGVLVDRDMHHVHRDTPQLGFECLASEVRVHGEAHQTRLRLYSGGAEVSALAVQPTPQRLYYRLEAARGAPATDRAVRADFWEIKLRPGLNRLALVIEGSPVHIDDPWAAYDTEAQRRALLVDSAWQASGVPDDVVATLAVAADAFFVQRGSTQNLSVIAGYPWFADWGRDSLIALPGLSLSTGRIEESLGVLDTFSSSLRGGLTPNNFFDDGQGAGYNTVDGSLWLATSLEKVVHYTQNPNLARIALSTIRGILREYAGGTAYGIGMDADDGLLNAGEPGAQLTWMDVKIHDWVVTPRHGKPVEIQALWISALSAETRLSRILGELPHFGEVLGAAQSSFSAFWNPKTGCLYDFLGRAGANAQLRPNALIALALPDTPATSSQICTVLDACSRELLTPLGLRTLSPLDPEYVSHYGGDRLVRDAAYHQGTVWPWLMGAYTDLLLRQGQVAEARAALSGLLGHLWEAGLGSVSEVISPDDLAPAGCPFQAWSVAEVLRAHIAVSLAEQALSLPRGLSIQPAEDAVPSPEQAELPGTPQPTPRVARPVRGGAKSQPVAPPPSDLIGGSTFGSVSLSGGLINMASVAGPLPELRASDVSGPLSLAGEDFPMPSLDSPAQAAQGEVAPSKRKRGSTEADGEKQPSKVQTSKVQPSKVQPGKKQTKRDAVSSVTSPTLDEAQLSELKSLTDFLEMPDLTSFHLPPVEPPKERSTGKPIQPNPAMSVEDPDVIEPLT
ncbi:glycogen debranching protein [Deinococcus psychrotolerans]|uniref:Glycogen debranching protein n=1 Tax=Deinococcus psychrotolerans TaxID=2489213 RepID=A0A3G8YQV8_9DEIO|nr:amylo-alpha-1,6-glucosidase [Deinococcus psychrotolerans]AZI43596.1 glycogen debranching protein [Deinococcus psychrotolerans]